MYIHIYIYIYIYIYQKLEKREWVSRYSNHITIITYIYILLFTLLSVSSSSSSFSSSPSSYFHISYTLLFASFNCLDWTRLHHLDEVDNAEEGNRD